MTEISMQGTFNRVDRELGRSVRALSATHPPFDECFSVASNVMSPSYRIVVALLILWRPTRARGIEALIAAVLSTVISTQLRNAIDRPRPGIRHDAGLPSRHAAAAVAIATVLSSRSRGRTGVLGLITTIGLIGRVTTGNHDPADIVCGAVLGGAVARIVTAVGRIATPSRWLRT